jgi:hypothetical protein
MKDRVIIGLAGYKGTGKSTVANRIKDILTTENPERETHIVSFAMPLKVFLAAVTQEPVSFWNTPEFKEQPAPEPFVGYTRREAMQNFGLAMRSKEGFGSAFWVNLAMRLIEGELEKCNIIIDDVRFPNEVEMIEDVGGGIFWLEAGKESDGHATEQNIEDLCYSTVSNMHDTKDFGSAAAKEVMFAMKEFINHKDDSV